MKTLHWIGTSLEDLRDFPEEARRDAGTDLRLVQQGEDPRDWKPLHAFQKKTQKTSKADIETGKRRYASIP